MRYLVKDIAVLNFKKIFFYPIFLLLLLFIFPYSSFATSTTTYYFDSIEKTYDENGTLLETKVYYPSSEVTLQKTVKRDGSKQMVYLYPDHLGSIILTTDYQGNKLSSSFYYPYGADFNIPSSPSSLNNITDQQYTSQKKDLSTSLYYYHARYYNPKTAHFISADKAEGPNRYAYVGNNPIMRNDPSGMMMQVDGGGGNFSGKIINLPHYNSKITLGSPKYSSFLQTMQNLKDWTVDDFSFVREVTNFINKNYEYNPDLLKAWKKQEEYKLKNWQRIENYEIIKDRIIYEWEIFYSLKLILKMLGNKEEKVSWLHFTADRFTSSIYDNWDLIDRAKPPGYDDIMLWLDSEIWAKLYKTSELIDQVTTNQAVCGVFALLELYGLKSQGIDTNYLTVYVDDNAGRNIMRHGLLLWNFQGTEYVIDPTWNLVMKYSNYPQYLFMVYERLKKNPKKIYLQPIKIDFKYNN